MAVITGTPDADFLDGTSSADEISGLAGADALYGGGGDDSLGGGAGNDWLDGGSGIDTMVGGTGDEVYIVTHLADVVVERAGEGSDRIETKVSLTLPDHIEDGVFIGAGDGSVVGNALDNFIYGNDSDNTLVGGAGDDALYGRGGDDSLGGGAGNDWLDGGSGIDTMVGGTGDEVYIVTHLADEVVERADGGSDRIETKVSLTLPGNIEGGNFIGAGDGSVVGNALDNFLYGNDSDNTLVGGAGVDFLYALGGDDSLDGGTGDDLLDGGPGIDTMVGGTGDEVYIVTHLADVVVERAGEGSDLIETQVNLTLPDHIEDGVFVGAGNGSVVGNRLGNFISGNDAENTLVGGAGADFLYALGGNDSLDGGTGDDWLDGGSGIDTMVGGTGGEVYIVTHLADVVVERAGEGSDRIETKVSLTLPDHIEDGVFIGAGDGSVVGNGLDNFIYGNDSDNTLVGGAGDDALYGGGGDDSLGGGAGNDWLDGGSGIDTMVGGTGDEVYIVTHLADEVVERAGEGSDRIETKVSLTLPDHIEDGVFIGAGDGSVVGNGLDNFIYGNDSDNTLVGGAGVDFLYGRGGNDSLVGGAGDDLLDGGAGVDTMVGGGGDDIYVVNTVSDLVVEAPGKGVDSVDTSVSLTLPDNIEGGNYTGPAGGSIVGNSFDNFITGNAFDNTLGGAGGIDTVSYAYEVNAVTVNLETGVASGSGADLLNDFENVEGGAGADRLIGDAQANTLDGRAGADTLSGGLGRDTYHVNHVDDAVVEDSNAPAALNEEPEALDDFTDTVVAAVSYSLADVQFVENLTLNGGATSGTGNALQNKLTGNSLHNKLSGLGGSDTLDGGGGRDTMKGGPGNDVYYVNVAGDVVTEGTSGGIDEIRTTVTLATLAANVENLRLTGATGIAGNGNGLANTITGNSAGNAISGGGGNDVLTGAGGADRFVFRSALNANSNVDEIVDFEAADRIQLDEDFFQSLSAGNLPASAFHVGAAAHDATDRIIYNSGTGRLFYDADGNGPGAKVLFATLHGAPVLAADDFEIIA